MAEKKKYELEFLLNTSSRILFPHLSTPSGLAEWFADDVNITDDTYTFVWEGVEEKAQLLSHKKDSYIRFQWAEDEDEDTYFEFRIEIDNITKEVALIVVDFAEEEEIEASKSLWETQIQSLKQKLGA